jgi:hypothetical protein
MEPRCVRIERIAVLLARRRHNLRDQRRHDRCAAWRRCGPLLPWSWTRAKLHQLEARRRAATLDIAPAAECSYGPRAARDVRCELVRRR